MTDDPLGAFEARLGRFAAGRRDIRTPFVMVPVRPRYERRVASRLVEWAGDPHRTEEFPADGTAQAVRLDELVVETRVFDLAVDLGGVAEPATIEETMRDRLSTELVDELLSRITDPGRQSHVVVLTHLGSLYPFSRAPELLDELDRRNVRSTVGIPFPGEVVEGKLSFLGEEPPDCYPARRIEGRVEREVHLQ